MLEVHAIPAFSDNYIWFIQTENSQDVLIVDPGDAAPVLAAIKQQNLNPIAILITHGCHDHVDGIKDIVSQYDIEVYGPKNEFIPHLTHPLVAQKSLLIADHFPAIEVLDIPGHTKGHIGFLINNKLFCGDTLFAAGCGRLHSGPAAVMFKSLQQIAQLPLETEIYCAHEYTQTNLHFAETIEPENSDIQQRIIETNACRQQGLPSLPSHLALELKTNPFLRCDKQEVKGIVERITQQELGAVEQVFTELRKWKDNF